MRNALRPAGFTLTELLISIGIVLTLIVGAGHIFRITSETVGAARAVSAASRDHRSTQRVFYDDLRSAAVDDAPFIILRSQTQPGYLDPNHESAGLLRPYRVDRFSFFARGQFRRQTGNPDQLIAAMSSGEAWIWYGHLMQPDFTAPLATPGRYEHRHPGQVPFPPGRNDENFHARDWVLGRFVMLLREKEDHRIYDDLGVPQPFIDRSDTVPPWRLSPLAINSQSAVVSGVDDGERRFSIQEARYDVAATSIDTFRGLVENFIRNIDLDDNFHPHWWDRFMTSSRFQGYPYPSRPHTPGGMARTVPVLLPRCSGFIVEFAGDFLKQDPLTGDVEGVYWDEAAQRVIPTDGRIDFYIDPDGVRRTQWYGLPRGDVVPLSDLWRLAPGQPSDATAPFERPPPPGVDAYVAAWGPDPHRDRRPRLIRITLTLEPANNRLSEGRTFEYVLRLGS